MKTDKIENSVVICTRFCSSVVTIKRNENETILQLIDEVENEEWEEDSFVQGTIIAPVRILWMTIIY